MEFHGDQRNNFWTFMNDERKNINLPRRRLSFGSDQQPNSTEPDVQFASARPSAASPPPIPMPMSPETPWMLSPIRTSPTQPLLYHCIASLHRHEGNIFSITISKDFVFTGSESSRIYAWKQPDCTVNALALSLSPNTCLLYSGSSDGLINFWEKERSSGRYNHGGFMQGHHFAVLCLVGLGELVFSGSEDATIRVWRREEGNTFHSCLAVIEGHHGPVRCLAVTLETENIVVKGLLVYSTSLDQNFKVWRVKVFPNEKVNWADQSAKDQEIAEGETSPILLSPVLSNPVLSPSWVEKKLQGNQFQF